MTGVSIPTRGPEGLNSNLNRAASLGYTFIVRQFLYQHMQHESKSYSRFQIEHLPLSLLNAAYNGHATTVDLLIRELALIDQPYFRDVTLILAAGRGHQDLVTALLEHGADANRRSITQVYTYGWKYLVNCGGSLELKTLGFENDNDSLATSELKLNKALQYGPGEGYQATISYLIA